jgi:hypothetical protein
MSYSRGLELVYLNVSTRKQELITVSKTFNDNFYLVNNFGQVKMFYNINDLVDLLNVDSQTAAYIYDNILKYFFNNNEKLPSGG